MQPLMGQEDRRNHHFSTDMQYLRHAQRRTRNGMNLKARFTFKQKWFYFNTRTKSLKIKKILKITLILV
jgi:hypothetical protein